MATATISSSKQGYTAPSDSDTATQISSTTTDMYTDGKRMGVVEFTTSINSALGTSAANFTDLNITSAVIKLKAKSSLASSTFTCGIGATIPPTAAGKTIPSTYTTCGGGTFAIAANTVYSFNITECFNKITSSSDFKPDDAKWYFVIKSSINASSITTFQRKSNYTVTLDITGGDATSTYYYTGSNWEKVQPYYYVDDTNKWVKCNAYYYTSSGWVKC